MSGSAQPGHVPARQATEQLTLLHTSLPWQYVVFSSAVQARDPDAHTCAVANIASEAISAEKNRVPDRTSPLYGRFACNFGVLPIQSLVGGSRYTHIGASAVCFDPALVCPQHLRRNGRRGAR
jgi:hypothetical protein